jgi:hypothetical protein
MEMNCGFFERGCDVINLLQQADANGATTTGDWVKLRDYARVGVLVVKGGSEDCDDTSIQFLQATDASGTSSKALSMPIGTSVKYKTGTITSQTVWTAVTPFTAAVDGIAVGSSVPSGSTRVIADLTTAAFHLYVEFQATELDADNGFDWFTIYLGNNANNALLISAWAILMDGRYKQSVPLSSIS